VGGKFVDPAELKQPAQIDVTTNEQAAASVAGVEGWAPVSLETLRERARPWSDHLSIEQPFGDDAQALPLFVLRGLLTKTEVDSLVKIAQVGLQKYQEYRGKGHGMISLDKAPELNASKEVQDLNRRLAALSGLPESNVEEGYFGVYNTGFTMDSLHMDNHHLFFTPARAVSFVIYLFDSNLEGGGTVFPAAKSSKALSQEDLERWTANLLHQRRENFKLGDDPQMHRVCPGYPGSMGANDYCSPMMELSKKLCAKKSSKFVVQARTGDAAMFFNYDSLGRQSAKALHGGCSVTDGDKVALAKFVRLGPKPPINDESIFTQALEARNARRKSMPDKNVLDDLDFDDEL